MKNEISLEAFYSDPPERVWKALTDPNALAKWFMSSSFRPLLGFRFRFEGLSRGKTSHIEGQVIELEEARKLAYTWDDGEDDSPGIVSWTLKPKDGGTHLTLVHRQVERAQPYVVIEASMNWRFALYASLPVMLRILESEGRRPRTPIVFVDDDLEFEGKPKRRAGFRQEEAPCRS